MQISTLYLASLIAFLFAVLPSRAAKPTSQRIHHRAQRSRRILDTPIQMPVEEKKAVIEPELPSTAPDTLPSSVGITHLPSELTVMPHMEVEHDREAGESHKVRRRQLGSPAGGAMAVYPKMCYFSPIQCPQLRPG